MTEQKMPEKCPLINTCNHTITESTSKYQCNTTNWINCPYARKEAEKYRKTPKEWQNQK